MKKILSVMLALMMLALPVFGWAEEAPAGGAFSGPETGLFSKYMAEGQEMVWDISIVPSNMMMLMMQMDQETTAAFRELMDALTLRIKGQRSGNLSQGGLELVVSGQSALNLLAATDQKQVYLSTNLLGETVCAFTEEELAQAVENISTENGTKITLPSGLACFSGTEAGGSAGDPATAMKEMLGTLDMTGFNAALNKAVQNAEVLELQEAPERLPDAMGCTRMILKKDDLKEVMGEAGKLLWSIPSVQNMLKAQGISEEAGLTEKCTAAVDQLQDDITVYIYMNAQRKMLIQASSSLVPAGEEGPERPVSLDVLTGPEGEGKMLDGTLAVTNGENTGEIKVTWAGKELQMNLQADLSTTDAAGTSQVLSLTLDSEESRTETSRERESRLKLTVPTEEGGTPVALLCTSKTNEADQGDHFEGSAELGIGIEGYGTLITLKADARTQLAEAYVVTEDAIHPMQMSKEKQEALMGDIQRNLTTAMGRITLLLPESVRNLIMQPQTTAD